MATIWPSLKRVASMPMWLIGEVLGAGALVGVLVVTWTDGTPAEASADLVTPAPAFTASVAAYADPAHDRTPIPQPAPPPEPPVPTAPPVMVLIPSINVHRPVEAVGLDGHGAMENTVNLWNAGWYKDGPVPSAPGDAVIEGHAGYPDAPLLFGRLARLHAGDKIVVVLADGTRRLFLVDSVAVWPAGTGPPGMGEPYGPARLTLITCTGPFDDHYKTYADRLAVEATYAGLA